MDLIESFLGLGGTVLFIGAIVLGLIGWAKLDLGFKAKSLGIFKVGALIFALGGVTAMGWLATAPETVITDDAVEWDATATEALAWVVPLSTNHYLVQMSFNDTSDAFVGATNFCTINFSVNRLDTGIGFAFTTGEVTTIGDYTSTTTGFTYDVIAKGTDGLYEADWTKSDSSVVNMEASMPVNRDLRGDSASLNLTASATCVAQMSQFHQVTTYIAVGGETFQVDWQKVTVVT